MSSMIQEEIDALKHHIKTQNLLAREEARILQTWKQWGISEEKKRKEVEGIAARLAHHLQILGHNNTTSASLRDWESYLDQGRKNP